MFNVQYKGRISAGDYLIPFIIRPTNIVEELIQFDFLPPTLEIGDGTD